MENGNQPINPCVIEGRQGFGNQPTISNKNVYGLTKREYFAGLAMQGIIAALDYPLDIPPERLSEVAIKMADELLKQLEK